jgi:hypothetical protein
MQSLTFNLTSKNWLCIVLILTIPYISTIETHTRILSTDPRLSTTCNTNALSNVLPNINPNSNLEAFKSTNAIKNICPNLRYSCCKEDELKYMMENMRKSFDYMNVRGAFMDNLFEKVKNLREETFDYFLNNFEQEDIKCYNSIQKKVIKKKLEMFENFPKITEEIKNNIPNILFDHTIIRNMFSSLQQQAEGQINLVKKTYEHRENFYSGFICSMCSPQFNSFFRLSKDKKPLMELNKYMCQDLMENKLYFIETLTFFVNLQRVVDMVYCRQKNLKSKQRRDIPPWENFNMVLFHIEYFPQLMKGIRDCISDPLAFVKDPNNKSNCRVQCQREMNLFQIQLSRIDKYILIENELFNQFYRSPASTHTHEQRYNYMMTIYNDEIQKMVDDKMMISNQNDKSELVLLFKPTKHDDFNFKDTTISINLHTGINVFNTKPNFKLLQGYVMENFVMVLVLTIYGIFF